MPRGLPYATRGNSSSPVTRFILLFGATLLSGNGRMVQRLIVPMAVDTSHRAGRRLTRHLLRRLTTEPEITDTLDAALSLQCLESSGAVRHAATAIERRLDACLEAIEHRTLRRSAWQRSLFDHTADVIGERQQVALAALRDHLVRRRADARELSLLRASELRLIAAWPSNRFDSN
jgi:hypothetical protein